MRTLAIQTSVAITAHTKSLHARDHALACRDLRRAVRERELKLKSVSTFRVLVLESSRSHRAARDPRAAVLCADARFARRRPISAMSQVLLTYDLLKSLSASEVSRDPELKAALRSLKHRIEAARPQTAPATHKALPTRPFSHSHGSELGDMSLRKALPVIKRVNAPQFRPPALFQLPAPPLAHVMRPSTSSGGRLRSVPERLPSAGNPRLGSIGPGWMGPHMRMETHRRPRDNFGAKVFALHEM